MTDAERPSQSLLTGPTISVFIGPERKKWTLHRRLLSHHSPFFASRSESRDDDRLENSDDDPSSWSLLISYLYQGSIPSVSDLKPPASKYDHAVSCHALYNLSLRFAMPHLANLAIDRFRYCLRSAHLVPDAAEIQDMYQSSPPDSGMRRLLIRIAARQIMDPEVERDVQAYEGCFAAHPDFAVGLVREMRRGCGGVLFRDPNSGEGREYLELVEGLDSVAEARIAQRSSKMADTSTGYQTPKQLPPTAWIASPNPAMDSFTPTGPDSATHRRKVSTPERLGDPKKLNETGSKVHFATPPKRQSVEHHARPTVAVGTSSSASSTEPPNIKSLTNSDIPNETTTNDTSQYLPKKVIQCQRTTGQISEQGSLAYATEEPYPGSPDSKRRDSKREAASGAIRDSRVDGIVSLYDSLAVNGGVMEPHGQPISRRRPRKLRRSLE